MLKFSMTREEHNRAVQEAIDRVHERNMQSKEASRKFLIEAGICKEEDFEPKAKSKTKKSK
jgi:hypothetical protein